jgi:hypothetical protein
VPLLKLCLDRLAPKPKGRLVSFELPPMHNVNDIRAAFGAVLRASGEGKLTTDEARDLAQILEGFSEAMRGAELVSRIEALEARINECKP